MRAVTILLAAGLGQAASIPRQTEPGCTNAQKRLEWRQLNQTGRESYTNAVLCLKTKPSRIGLATSLYDDFPYIHARLNNESE
jgi:tyrosinase